MDWIEYKARCDSPAAFSRWMLLQTIELVDADEDAATRLRAALGRPILDKPADHSGNADTDMFELDLDEATVERITMQVTAAAARGVSTTGTERRGLGGFEAAWREYGRFLARAGANR